MPGGDSPEHDGRGARAGAGVTLLVVLLTLLLLGLVAVLVSAPLRRAREREGTRAEAAPQEPASGQPQESGPAQSDSTHRLEAEREAKYREIRDAELDFRTGKLSREDYAAIDADLRAEALQILDSLQHRVPARPENQGDSGTGHEADRDR